MNAFRNAEALATQRYDRDQMLSLVHEVTTHFRMPNSLRTIEDAGGMSVLGRCSRSLQWINPNNAGTISRRGFGRSGRLASIVAAAPIGLGVHAS